MFVPKNEQGVVALFCYHADGAGWELAEMQTKYPDGVIKKDGEVWRVEFEYVASNFVLHAHDPRRCDMIICWENDYADSPLPIMAISDLGAMRAHYEKAPDYKKEIEYWRMRALRAERKRVHTPIDAGKTVEENRLTSKGRQKAIADVLKDRRNVRLSELTSLLGVSINTVKNDIKKIDGADLTGNGMAQYVNGHVEVTR